MGCNAFPVPNRLTKPERKKLQRNALVSQSPEVAHDCEGRISLLKRAPRTQPPVAQRKPGMERWVGLGVIGE